MIKMDLTRTVFSLLNENIFLNKNNELVNSLVLTAVDDLGDAHDSHLIEMKHNIHYVRTLSLYPYIPDDKGNRQTYMDISF